MASLAGLLQKSGYRVTGSDANIYPPMSTLLKSSGIDIKPGYQRKNISDDIDQVIIGNAVSKDNQEVLAVQEKNIPYISFPEAIKKFYLENQKSLVITGTHGKTTTTSLIASIFQETKIDPTIINGGVINSINNSAKLGKSDWSILEADESDGSFVHVPPTYSIITNMVLCYGCSPYTIVSNRSFLFFFPS